MFLSFVHKTLISCWEVSFLCDTLALPGYVAVASAIILISHLILSSAVSQQLHARGFRRTPSLVLDNPPESGLDILPANVSAEFNVHIAHHGGAVIYKTARLVGYLVLLGFSVYSFIIEVDAFTSGAVRSTGEWGEKRLRKHRGYNLSVREWLEFSMCLNYVCPLYLAVPYGFNPPMLVIRISVGTYIRICYSSME